MALTMAEVARDYETDGVPSSGPHKIKKNNLRGWGAWVEGLINAFVSAGGLIYSSRDGLYADLGKSAHAMAWVMGDAIADRNGIYEKIGASGTGSWFRLGDLPYSFIVASDAGAGTANAIQATTSIPVSGSALIWTNIFEANTTSPVTISFNGGSALTIKTNTGNNVAAGGLVAGMIVLGIVSGSTFRLISDQASSAIVAAAEAAQAAAETAAAEAEAVQAALESGEYGYDIGAPYVLTQKEKQADGFRSIMEWISPTIRTDIRNGEYAGNLSAQLYSAFQSGEDIDLGVGVFPIEDSPAFSQQYQCLRGLDREKSIIKVGPGFNMAQTAVIHGVPYSEVYDLSVQFEQPSDATEKADLIQYPFAFTAQAAQRSQWRRIGWKSAWGGFHAIGVDLTNNPTGILIDDVKDGSFEWSIRIAGAYDFVGIENWHAWEFGFTNTDLADIAYSEPGKFEVGHVETLDIGTLRLWQKVFQLANNSIFETSIGTMKLDGWSSRLEISAGTSQIGMLDIRCDNTTAREMVSVTNGSVVVSNIDLFAPNLRASDYPLIRVANGAFRAEVGRIAAHASQLLGLATGGEMDIGAIQAVNGSNTARTLPFWQQSGANGKIILRDAVAPPIGSGSGAFASVATDAGHVIRADFQGWKLAAPTSYLSNFQGSLNIGDDF